MRTPFSIFISDIKLKILGPSNAHLLECAELIGEKTRDSVNLIDSFFKRDARASEATVYRQLADALFFKTDSSNPVDASATRPGPLINLQSVVTQFECAGHKFLFAGDFQFADPQTKNPAILNGVEEIKAKIKEESPYSFVKLSHHGSDNAFSEEMLADLGDTKNFGLCAGRESTHHPAREILKLLDEHRDKIKWARTDHNGLVTFVYKKNKKEPEIKIEKGVLNDAKPNHIDLTASISAAVQPSPTVSSTKSSTAAASREESSKSTLSKEIEREVSEKNKSRML